MPPRQAAVSAVRLTGLRRLGQLPGCAGQRGMRRGIWPQRPPSAGRLSLAAEPKAYGRYEAARPNERWITDVLVGPWVPYPRREGSARARLFLIVDDHSRLLV